MRDGATAGHANGASIENNLGCQVAGMPRWDSGRQSAHPRRYWSRSLLVGFDGAYKVLARPICVIKIQDCQVVGPFKLS